MKSWLIGKDFDAGRDWGQEEKGTTEDEMDGWHHWLNGRESEWTLGVGDGQGRPGMLQFMGSQRVGHNWVTELNWTEATREVCQGVREGCVLLPSWFNFYAEYLYAEYIMRNAGMDEAQVGIKIAGRNINNLRYADDPTLMAESEELKSLLRRRVKKLA